MSFYTAVKSEFGEEQYLQIPCRLKRANIPKLRSSSHDLRVEKGRYTSDRYNTGVVHILRNQYFGNFWQETTFLYVSCYPDHYEPKIFFRFFLQIFFSDRKFSKSRYFKSFSGNYYCSCFMLPWSLWSENIFSIFEIRNYPSIYAFGLEVSPENAISEYRPPLCNSS